MSTVAEELRRKILENLNAPAKASGDAGSVEQHSLSEQLKVIQFLLQQEAAKQKSRGLLFNRFVPPGAM